MEMKHALRFANNTALRLAPNFILKKPFWFANNTASCLSPNFNPPKEKQPCLSDVPPIHSVPIIDLKGYDECQTGLVKDVSQACQQLGMFQVINHGVPSDLCQRVMAALLDFFKLPSEERAPFLISKPVKLFNYSCIDDDQNTVAMWTENLSHPWHPTEDFTHHLPTNPPQYRDIFTAYSREIGTLVNTLFSLMSQGLGLEKDSLMKRLGERPNLLAHAHYYPPCHEPDVTMGMREHNDITAITILQQLDGVPGLQVKHDGKWEAVDPVPGALVIILPDQMQVLTNGRYKSPVHRAVTNRLLPRLSLVLFYAPNDETVIGPMEELTDEEHPPIYRSYRYKEFVIEFFRQKDKTRMKEAFEL